MEISPIPCVAFLFEEKIPNCLQIKRIFPDEDHIIRSAVYQDMGLATRDYLVKAFCQWHQSKRFKYLPSFCGSGLEHVSTLT